VQGGRRADALHDAPGVGVGYELSRSKVDYVVLWPGGDWWDGIGDVSCIQFHAEHDRRADKATRHALMKWHRIPGKGAEEGVSVKA